MNRAIRTDLAIELREDIKDRGKIDGIEIETRISQEKIKTTIIHVNDQTGADTLGKPVGTYITIECPEIREFDEDIHKPTLSSSSRRRSSENHSSLTASSRKKVDFPAPCPPTRQSIVSNLHPGWNTRLMAPSRKILMASQVYSSSAAPRKWCRTWAIRSVPSHCRPFR